ARRAAAAGAMRSRTTATATGARRRWAASRPMRSASTTSRATSANGSPTAGMTATGVRPRPAPPGSTRAAACRWCAAAPGPVRPSRRAAPGARRRRSTTPTHASASGSRATSDHQAGAGHATGSLRAPAATAGGGAPARLPSEDPDPRRLHRLWRVLLLLQPDRGSGDRREGADRPFAVGGGRKGPGPAGLPGDPVDRTPGGPGYADRARGARDRAQADRQGARGGGGAGGRERAAGDGLFLELRLGRQRDPVRPGQRLLPARRQDGGLHRPGAGGAERARHGGGDGPRDRACPAAPRRPAHGPAEAVADGADGRRDERHGSAAAADGHGGHGLWLPAALRAQA